MREKKIHTESAQGVEAVLQRMWESVGRPLVGYAKSFDVSESDIKNWRRRGRVARAYLEQFASEQGVSLDWLLHGDLPVPEQAAPHQVSENVRPYGLSADEAALLEAYRGLDPEARASLQNLLRVIAGRAISAVPRPAAPVAQDKSGRVPRPARIKVMSSNLPDRQFSPPEIRGGRRKKGDAA